MTDEERTKLHSLVPELPEDFKQYVIDSFEGYHVTFYSRPYGDIFTECCHCGRSFRFRPGKTSRGSIPAWGDHPKPEKKARFFCPNCGEETIMYPKGNRKNPIEVWGEIWYGQAIENGGYLLRYFRPMLASVPDQDQSYEELYLGEKMRIFFPVGWEKKSYKEYKHEWTIRNRYTSQDFYGWNSSSCFNTMSYWYNGPSRGDIHPDTYRNMKGTVMEYSLSEEVMDDPIFNSVNLGEWQQAFIRNKWFESLYKMGLGDIVRHKLDPHTALKFNGRAKNVWNYLKIYKPRLKELMKTSGRDQYKLLDIFQSERASGEHWDDTVIELSKMGFSAEDLEYVKRFTTAKKLVNYFEKQRGRYALGGAKVLYMDYLRMKESSGYDMTSSITIFPKDLVDAHKKIVEEVNEAEADKRKKEAEAKFKAISNRYKGADKVYHFEKGAYIIRPAKTATEIVDEGRILHHCVGGDDYLTRHAKKKSIICFMRRKKSPNKPYITVEVSPEGEILQWYGVYDSKPNEAKIDKWLEGYRESLDPKLLMREAKRKSKLCS